MRLARQFSQTSKILVVGGGQIGKAVAIGLKTNGYTDITVADPNPTNQAILEKNDIKFVSDAKGLGENCEVLFTALPKPEHVRFVMETSGLLEELEAGSIWIDHTSTDPNEATRLAHKATDLGIKIVEAPLTGGLQERVE